MNITKTIGRGAQGSAIEGLYYKAASAVGAGTAMGIQTSFSATANVAMMIRNPSTASKKIVLDFIKMINTAAGASTTSSHIAAILDTADRWSAGATTLAATGAHSGLAGNSAADIRIGIITAVAAVSPRVIGRAVVRQQTAPCWAVNDTLYLTFAGGNDIPYSTITGAGPLIVPIPCGPAVIAPNTSFLLHMWNVANATTAPSWEWEIGYWEL